MRAICRFSKILQRLTVPRKIYQFGCKRCQKKRKDVSYQLLQEFKKNYFAVHERSAVKNSFSTYVYVQSKVNSCFCGVILDCCKVSVPFILCGFDQTCITFRIQGYSQFWSKSKVALYTYLEADGTLLHYFLSLYFPLPPVFKWVLVGYRLARLNSVRLYQNPTSYYHNISIFSFEIFSSKDFAPKFEMFR